MLAEMAREVAAARAAHRAAAAAKDRGEPHRRGRRRSPSGPRRTPRCASPPTPCSSSARAATRARPVERLMRDAKGAQIYEGTNQIHRLIVADEVLRNLAPFFFFFFFHASHDRAGLRGWRRIDGPRDRPGPRRDRAPGRPVRAGAGPRRGRTRADRGQPGPVGREGPSERSRSATRRSAASRPPPTSPRAADADLVIEAVFEDIAVKSALWRDLDALAPAHAIFASNTSLDRHPSAGRGVGRAARERFVGMHFFSPVPVMPLVELIRGARHLATRRSTPSGRSRRTSASRSSSRPTGRASSSTGSSCRSSARRCAPSRRASARPRTSTPAPGSGSTIRWVRSSSPTSSGSTSASASCACSTTGSAATTSARRRVLTELVDAGHLGQKTGQGFYTYPRPERPAADGDRRPDRGGAAPPGDRARLRDARARAGRRRARRGRAVRPLAVREDGRAGPHRRATPRGGRRGRASRTSAGRS